MPPYHQRALAPALCTPHRPLYLNARVRPISSKAPSLQATSASRQGRFNINLLGSSRAANFMSRKCCLNLAQRRLLATVLHIRHRTSLSTERTCISSWDRRLKSSWHHPGCKWVRSGGTFDKTPRDQDCPACQEDQRRPFELSPRELAWARRVEAMKAYVQRDPYEALFGTSNRLLRGTVFAKFMMNRPYSPWWTQHATVSSPSPIKSTIHGPEATASVERSYSGPERKHEGSAFAATAKEMDGNSLDKGRNVNTGSQEIMREPSVMQAAVQYTESSISTSRDEFQFDPISMRMVKKQRFDSPQPVVMQARSEEDVGINIPVKTSFSSSRTQKSMKGTQNVFDEPFRSQEFAKQREQVLRARHDWLLREGFKLETMLANQAESTDKKNTLALFRQNTLDICDLEFTLNILTLRRALLSDKDSTVSNLIERFSIAIQEASRTLYTVKRLMSNSALKSSSSGLNNWRNTNFSHAPKTWPESSKTRIAGNNRSEDLPKTKRMLEQSWARETASNRSDQAKISEIAATKTQEQRGSELAVVNRSKQLLEKVPSSTGPVTNIVRNSDPIHSTWPSGQQHTANARIDQKTVQEKQWKDKIPSRVLKFPLVEKEKPLAQMTLAEIEKHREKLLDSWAKKHNNKSAADAATRKLTEEIVAQKAAMAAYETRHSKRNPPVSSSSREKEDKSLSGGESIAFGSAIFNKGTKLHDKESLRAAATEEQKKQNQALVKDIQNIYENVYGKIDANHQQLRPQLSSQQDTSRGYDFRGDQQATQPEASVPIGSDSTSTPSPMQAYTPPRLFSLPEQVHDPALYIVLAYDPANQSIYTASASSSFVPPTGETLLSVSDSLSRLHAPAKFLPHLAQHQENGYDIVSSSKHLLVFKRMRQRPIITPGTNAPSSGKPRAASTVNPVDPAVQNMPHPPPAPQVGNFASPTGFVNHDTPFGPTHTSPSPLNSLMRKEEPIFSGNARFGREDGRTMKAENRGLRGEWRRLRGERRRGRLWRILKRVVLIGVWTAACGYAIGVVMEYFRTGGSGEQEERGWGGIDSKRRTKREIED